MKGNKRSLKERRIRSSCYRIGCCARIRLTPELLNPLLLLQKELLENAQFLGSDEVSEEVVHSSHG